MTAPFAQLREILVAPRFAVIALAIIALSPTAVRASCGDYVTVGNPRGGVQKSRHGKMSMPVANVLNAGENVKILPQAPPCDGPNCDGGDSRPPAPAAIFLQRLSHESCAAASGLDALRLDDAAGWPRAECPGQEVLSGYPLSLLRPPQIDRLS